MHPKRLRNTINRRKELPKESGCLSFILKVPCLEEDLQGTQRGAHTSENEEKTVKERALP
jgi:hypothetical protein